MTVPEHIITLIRQVTLVDLYTGMITIAFPGIGEIVVGGHGTAILPRKGEGLAARAEWLHAYTRLQPDNTN